jgi:hypothetical protein
VFEDGINPIFDKERTFYRERHLGGFLGAKRLSQLKSQIKIRQRQPMLDLRLRSVDYQQATIDSLVKDMGADFNRYRTEALLKQRSLAEAEKLGLFKVRSSVDSSDLRERVRYINERGINVLKLKSRW